MRQTDDALSNPSSNPSFEKVSTVRYSRRQLLVGDVPTVVDRAEHDPAVRIEGRAEERVSGGRPRRWVLAHWPRRDHASPTDLL